MYVSIGIHHPKPGKEREVLETMVRFGANALEGVDFEPLEYSDEVYRG